MANYQTQVNSDDSITVTAKTTDTILFGLTTEQIEQLPLSIHKNYFVTAGTVDKIGYQFRTIPFKSPSSNIKEVKDILDLIRDFIALQRDAATARTNLHNLEFNFKRQEKQLLEFKNRKYAQTKTQLDLLSNQEKPTEVVAGVAVVNTISTKEKLVIEDTNLDAFNTLMKANLIKLPEEVYKAQQLPIVLKATFTTYYLLGDGATRVDTEYSV